VPTLHGVRAEAIDFMETAESVRMRSSSSTAHAIRDFAIRCPGCALAITLDWHSSLTDRQTRKEIATVALP